MAEGIHLVGDRGSALIEPQQPGFVLVRYSGICEEEFATRVIEQLDDWVAEGLRVIVAIDALELSSYSSEFRRQWTRWLLDNRPHLEAFEVLTQSRIATMGIAVVNAATGGTIRAHTNSDSFMAALSAALQSAA